MFRDPLYRQIRRQLRDLKDGIAFEACVNDVLRKIWPTISPREGGSDAGLDGLIVNKDNKPIQLICTTGKNCLTNLSQSIESNLKKDGKSDACIFATSQQLSNAKKRALETRAIELGRSLIQIYDQAGIAGLLYRDSHWLKELLGLTGSPPALSVFPITSRPLDDIEPLGRDDDLKKITTLRDDLVLVGQPGAGKTHLLFQAAKKAKGRFVVDEDLTRIANAVRDIAPKILLVDDAHSRLEFLKRLKHLRQDIEADFKIVATCWPGQEEAVCSAIQLVKDKCQTLESLSPKQIKEVIQSQKIFGPPGLLTEIIHQSQGKPGLAVTLCRLCWESGTSRDVVLGNALARDIKQSFEPLLGKTATHLLACFSLGGSVGMTLESVARLLNTNPIEIKHAVEQLSAAGVLDVSRENRICVYPTRLRQALVRDVFMKAPALDMTPFLAEAPDYGAATRVIIEAKIMGGIVRDEFLRQRLQQLAPTGENATFEEYAYLGCQETEWVLDNYPEKLEAIGSVALSNSPNKTLGMLLDSAVVTYRERSSQHWPVRSEDLIPKIKRWILSSKPNDDEVFRRREILANILTEWVKANRESIIAIYAAKLVLSLKHEDSSTPPGEPRTVTIHWGIVAQSHLKKIFSLWSKVLPILKQAELSEGAEIADIFHEWIHPNHPGKGMPSEYVEESRGYAHVMMTDLLEAFADKWTFHHHLHNYAEKLKLIDKVQISPIAEVLYPSRDSLDWENEQKRCEVAADGLALGLKNKKPNEAADLLTTIEDQAKAAKVSYSSWGRHVCRKIADTVENIDVWIKALFDRNAPPFLIGPFLHKLAQKNPNETHSWISLALKKPSLQWLGVELCLEFCAPESANWQEASPLFVDCAQMIEGMVLRNEIPIRNLKTLLNFHEPRVCGVVAVGLCGAKSKVEIPDELYDDWRQAIIKHVDESDEHVLVRVFPKNSEVAFEWIAWRLDGIQTGERPFYFGLRYDRALPAAIAVLSKEQKRTLIGKLTKSSNVSELARFLVAGDLELYDYILSIEKLGFIRLDPLRIDNNNNSAKLVTEFDESWQKLALLALERGFSESDIVNATQRGDNSWVGAMSSMYASRLAPFEKLLANKDSRLQRVGDLGAKYFRELRDNQLAAEKRAAIRGELF